MCEGVFNLAIAYRERLRGIEATCADTADRYPDTRWVNPLKLSRRCHTFALQLWLYPQTEDLGGTIREPWWQPSKRQTTFPRPFHGGKATPGFSLSNGRAENDLAAWGRPSSRPSSPTPGLWPQPTDHDFPNRETERARRLSSTDALPAYLAMAGRGERQRVQLEPAGEATGRRKWGVLTGVCSSFYASEHQSLGPLRALDAGHPGLYRCRRTTRERSLSPRRSVRSGLNAQYVQMSVFPGMSGRTIHRQGKQHHHRRRKFEPAAHSLKSLHLHCFRSSTN